MAYTEEYFYNSDKFTSIGMFNGFPFSLVPKPSFLNMETGLTTGLLNREVSSNSFWNLAAVEVDFIIRTDATPAIYESGFAYNPDGTPGTGHIVSVEYEVLNSYDSGEYLPEERMYREITGGSQIQNLDASGLIVGSGDQLTSLFLTDDPDFYIPLTIQPDNTGAFVITLDSGVADYFYGRSGYDSRIDKFEANMLFDFGVSHMDENGNEFNNIDYYEYTRTGYLVPKSGFEFSIEGSRIKGIYYTYPLEETTAPLNVVQGIKPPKQCHAKMMMPPERKNKNGSFCIGEPHFSVSYDHSSKYTKNEVGTYECEVGDANLSTAGNVQKLLEETTHNYTYFPKNKINTLKGTTPDGRKSSNIPTCGVNSLPLRGKSGPGGNV
jgi:hypothetical protein